MRCTIEIHLQSWIQFLNFALLLISFSIPVIVADNWTVGVPNTKHVCRSKCGNLTVPYPFGIMSGSACSMNPSFDIICDESSDPPKAFLGLFGHIMVSGIYETTIHIKNQPARTCYNNGEITAVDTFGMDFSGTPFSFSDENKLTAVGCNDAAFIFKSPNNNIKWNGVNQSIASCLAICSEYWYPSNGFCSGSGCCQASIPKGVQSIYYHMESLRGCNDEHGNISACSHSFLAEQDSYTFNVSHIFDPSFLEKIKQVPIVLDWAIDNRTCNQSANAGEMVCQRHSVCVDSGSPLGGYHCNCSHGYQGNPYLSPGCCWTLSGTRMISQLSSPFTFLKSALLLISLSIPGIVADDSNAKVAKHGCPSTCGNLTVPYPFGIGLGSSCSINPSYDIICDESSDPPQAFLSSGSGNILIIGIYETTIHIKNQPARICYDHNKITAKDGFGISILGTPFSFSNENKLTVVGCDEAAFILRSPGHAPLRSGANEFISSCVAICSEHEDLSDGFCSGIGCCQASIPEGVQSIYSFMMNLYEHIKDHNDSSCSYSFLAEQSSYTFNISDISDPSFHNKVTESVPIVLDWVISNQTCNQTGNTGELLCQRHSECVDSGSTLGGYHCNCSQGYQGNPYLTPGVCWMPLI